MAGNRAAAESVILKWVGKLDPSGKNTAMYVQFFERMSDKDFERFMQNIEDGTEYISMVVDNLTGKKISIDNNLKVAEEMGHEFFHRIWQTDVATGRVVLSNQRCLVVDLPVRRQIQTLVNKISIPEDNRHIDELTDQPVGVSKGSSMSQPETLVLYAQGANRATEEFLRFRGGDLKAMHEMDRQIIETGGVKLDQLAKINSRAKATQTLSTFFKAMHLDNNL